MPLLLGAVADDYTGASDLANTLNRNGLSTIQTIGVPPSGLKVDDAEAIHAYVIAVSAKAQGQLLGADRIGEAGRVHQGAAK